MSEKLSHGSSINRRRILADERSRYFPTVAQRGVQERFVVSKDRIREINDAIGGDSLSPLQKTELTIEKLWCEFSLGRISNAERQSKIQVILNQLQTEEPGIFKSLTDEDQDGICLLARIREKVFPTPGRSVFSKRW